MNKKFTDISSVCVLILYLFLVARMFRNNIPLYILVLFFSVINITIVLSGHELGHLFFGKIFGFKLSSISFCGAEYNGYLKKWSYDFKQRKENHCLMNPKSDSSNTHIYLYLLGGIISNILLIIICILLFLKNTNLILRAFLFNNIFINTVNLINTVFPVRDVEFLSDSDIIWYIHKEKIQLEFLKKQLKISHSIEFNKTIGESSYINMENVKYENLLTFFCRYSNYYLAIKNNDLNEAYNIMQKLYNNINYYSLNERKQLLLEELFISSVLKKETDINTLVKKIKNELYDKESFDYIRTMYVYSKNIKMISDYDNPYYYRYKRFNFTSANEYVDAVHTLICTLFLPNDSDSTIL